MAYQVIFRSSATRALKKFARPLQEEVISAAESMKTNPRPPGVKKLRGYRHMFRIDLGAGYRIAYEVADNDHVVTIWAIADRKDIYAIVRRLT